MIGGLDGDDVFVFECNHAHEHGPRREDRQAEPLTSHPSRVTWSVRDGLIFRRSGVVTLVVTLVDTLVVTLIVTLMHTVAWMALGMGMSHRYSRSESDTGL
jgi:hypothetical protein